MFVLQTDGGEEQIFCRWGIVDMGLQYVGSDEFGVVAIEVFHSASVEPGVLLERMSRRSRPKKYPADVLIPC